MLKWKIQGNKKKMKITAGEKYVSQTSLDLMQNYWKIQEKFQKKTGKKVFQYQDS